jgi:hypothetical protein
MCQNLSNNPSQPHKWRVSISHFNRTTWFWILNCKQIGLISATLSAIFEITRSTLEFSRSNVARSIFNVALCRSIACRMIDFSSIDEFRSIDYKVDWSICLGRFSKWQEQTWTLEVMEIILDVFSSLSRMFWTSFQLRPANKTKHKSTTKHYIYNTN